MRNARKAFTFGILCLALLLLSACEELSLKIKEGETEIEALSLVTPPPSPNLVCSPFGGGSLGRDQGLKTSLHYLSADLPHYDYVADYLQHGTKIDADLYLDQVNVPTRPFDAGFVTNEGTVMKTPAGDTLYEWFALHMESEIRLTDQDSTGRYQFALLADDGAVALYEAGNQWQTLVDNDGTHATRFAVGTSPITFDRQTRMPMKLKYFQGPRFHIAAVLLWRPWPDAVGAWADPLNGHSGNDLFFDSTQRPSAPKPAYQQLLARGWKPVAPGNFFLPATAPANPCPAWSISDVTRSSSRNSVTMRWKTTEHATRAKLRWGLNQNALTNEVETANVNTQHQFTVNNLLSDTNYYFQGVSTDEYSQEQRTAVLDARTLPNDPASDWTVRGFDATTDSTSAVVIWQTADTETRGVIKIGRSAQDPAPRLVNVNDFAETHVITVTSLIPDTAYYLQVTAEDRNARSIDSNVITKRTRAP